jgi:Sec-independent protein secretion pathway component TatC
MKSLAKYFAKLTTGRIILWCYLIWYLVVLCHYFDSSLRLWLTSVGLAAIVGTALYISSTAQGNKLGAWQIARLFMMPFFVSSFAALVKNRGFILVFSPKPMEILLALGLCALFGVTVWILKRVNKQECQALARHVR